MSQETALSLEIKELLLKDKCILKTDTSLFKTKNESITYTCACGKDRTKIIKDYIRRNCRTCKDLKIRDDEFKESETDQEKVDHETGEIWRRIKGGWVSSFGKCKNTDDKLLKMCMSKYRYNIGGKQEYASRLVAKTFRIDGYEKLQGNQSYIVRFHSWYEPESSDNEAEKYQKTVDNFKVSNLRVGSKEEYEKKSDQEPEKKIEKTTTKKSVSQYTKDTNKFIASFKTVAEASRNTVDKEHQIRAIIQGKENANSTFLWKSE
jgi:hypothetical protein